jgi:hypothetical protein
MRAVLSVLVLLLLLIPAAYAADPQLTARQQQIFKSVLAVDAQLTKEQYDQFWADFPKLTPGERKELYTSGGSMTVGLQIHGITTEIGTGSFFHAFFSTISHHLEPKGWGTVYPY